MFETILHAVTYCTQSCSHSNEAMPYQDPDYGSLTLITHSWFILILYLFPLTCITCVITFISITMEFLILEHPLAILTMSLSKMTILNQVYVYIYVHRSNFDMDHM